MSLHIHPNAIQRFNELGAAIRAKMTATSPLPSPLAKQWQPDIFVHEVRQEGIIGPIRSISKDTHEGFVLQVDSDHMLLPAASEEDYWKLCEGLHRAIQPRGTTAPETVERLVREWLTEQPPEPGVVDFLLGRLAELVKPRTVWWPIAGMHIQTPLTIGFTTFCEFSQAQIDAWHYTAAYKGLPPEDREPVDARFAKLAREHRGFAAGVVRINAEPQIAELVARDCIELSLAMLRFFSPPAWTPQSRSLVTPSGRERREQYELMVQSEAGFSASSGLLDAEKTSRWALSSEAIPKLWESGLGRLHAILTDSGTTEFEQRVVAAVQLYSEATLERRPEFKLVLVFGALESLFLGNANGIRHNVGERMAILSESTLERRKHVIDTLNAAYKQRSKFVHHAKYGADEVLLEEFFRCAWKAVRAAIRRSKQYANVQAFTGALDDEKLS